MVQRRVHKLWNDAQEIDPQNLQGPGQELADALCSGKHGNNLGGCSADVESAWRVVEGQEFHGGTPPAKHFSAPCSLPGSPLH